MTILFETLQILLVLLFIGYVAWLWSRRTREQQDLHRTFLAGRNRLLEQFDSPQALLDFAATETGRALLEAPRTTAPMRPEGLRLIQAGLVILFVGFGFRSSYYVAMNWRAANVHLNEIDAFYKALGLWQWGQFCLWAGAALFLGGLLAFVLGRLDRTRGIRADLNPPQHG